MLKPGFTLPPLMFSLEEVEALALGARWVERRSDESLSKAAGGALAKIAAVLPSERAEVLDWPTLIAGPSLVGGRGGANLRLARTALSGGRKLGFAYEDKSGRRSARVVWPVAVGFFDNVTMLAAWCEAREAFRHFRLDRMEGLTVLEQRPPRTRRTLFREWRRAEGLDE